MQNALYRPELVSLIYILLPGFLSAWIVYGLTVFQKPSAFERIVQSLIFTMLSDVTTTIIGRILLWAGRFVSLGAWDENAQSIWRIVAAIVLGFIAVAVINNNFAGNHLPKWLTKRTSYPSEWYSAFSRTKRPVFLHLTGDRRLYATVEEWPDDPVNGHFVLSDLAWVLPTNEPLRLVNTLRMLVKASDVEMVEFVSENPLPEDEPSLVASVSKMIEYNKTLATKSEANGEVKTLETDKQEDRGNAEQNPDSR